MNRAANRKRIAKRAGRNLTGLLRKHRFHLPQFLSLTLHAMSPKFQLSIFSTEMPNKNGEYGMPVSVGHAFVALVSSLFGDLRRYRSSAKHYRHPLSKVCQQQFLYENGTQLCSYLVCRFVFDQGLGTRKEINQNNLFVIWQCSNFSCLGLLTEAQITRAPWSYVFAGSL